MKIRFFGLVLGGLMLVAGSAQAAVLSLDTTNSIASTVPLNFNPGGFPGGLVTPGVTPITIYSGPVGGGGVGGLTLDSAAKVTFEYLGKEAGFSNIFDLGGDIFNTGSSAVGDTAQRDLAAGIIPFLFQTGALSAQNGGPIAAGISMAFADLGDGSFLAMFNDGGGGDFDYDDLVVRVSVSAVPLPAAAWLLLSAILGLVSFSRVRRGGAQTA